jgi:hypothetical protein
MSMLNFILKMYSIGRYTLEQTKALLKKHSLTSQINIVEEVDTHTIKFTENSYQLQAGEKFLNEIEFFTN